MIWFRWVGLRAAVVLLVGVSLLATGCFVPSQIEGKKQSSHTDDFGDPLPVGAIARIGTTRLRTSGSLAISLDGKLMASSFVVRQSRSVCVWETEGGDKRLDMDCEDPFVALSPDGTMLATCGKRGDMGVRLWDMQTGKKLRQIQIQDEHDQPRHGIRSLAFLPDGQSLAVISWYDVPQGKPEYPRFTDIRLLDVKTGRSLRSFTAPDDNGRGWMHFCFSPDGKTMSMVGGKEQTVYLWDMATGKILRTLGKGESSSVFSADGRVLAIAGYKAIRLIELSTGKELRTFTDFDGRHGGPGPIALSPNGNLLASGGGYGDRVIRVWGAKTGKLIRHFPQHQSESAQGLAFLHDNTTLLSACGANIRMWNLVNGREKLLANVFRRPVSCVLFSPDGKTLALCGNDPGVRLHDVATRKLLRHFEKDAYVRSMAFSPDSSMLVTAGDNLRLWKIASGKRLQSYLERTTKGTDLQCPSSVGFLPDGKQIVSASYDGIIRLWNINETKPICQYPQDLKYHQRSAAIHFMAVPPNGNQLAIRTTQWKIHIWHCMTGKRLSSFSCYGNSQARRPLAMSPDGRLLAFEVNRSTKKNYVPHTVALQEIAGEKQELLLDSGRERGLSLNDASVVFSPDSKLLATGTSFGKSVRLWDVATAKERYLLEGHLGGVSYLDFSPDGKILATASGDGTVLLWAIAPGSG